MVTVWAMSARRWRRRAEVCGDPVIGRARVATAGLCLAAIVLSVAWAATAAGAAEQPIVTPVATPTPTPTPTDQTVSPTPTPTPTESPTSTPTPTTTPTATPTATESPSPRPTVSDSESPSPSPSVTVSSPAATRPATPPAVQESDIPFASVLAAMAVLALALVALLRVYRHGEHAVPDLPAARAAHPKAPVQTTVDFVLGLGKAMLESGDPVTHVEASLGRIAAVNGLDNAAVIVLPAMLLVSVPGDESVQTAVTPAYGRLRLDQVDAVFQIVDEAEKGQITPAQGLARLQAAHAMPPSFSPFLRVVGYAVLTVGLALILRGGWDELLIAGTLGTIIGALHMESGRLPSAYQVFLPIVSSFGVALIVFVLARTDIDLQIYPPLIAPLVAFLPGALLTTSVIELATGQMMSGAGRLAAGGMQLVLLALGIVTAGQLVGIPGTLVSSPSNQPISLLAPWVGVAIFGAGVVLHQSARRGSLGWIILILYVAYAGQLLGGVLFGSQLSAFFGALAMTPVAMFVAQQRTGPPTLVTFLPGFWILVPGALGLAGVTKYIGADRVDGVASLVAAGATMVGIALGVLVGLGIGSVLLRRGGRPGARLDLDPEGRTAPGR